MTTAISIENVSKCYRLGTIGGGTLAGDLNRWWARLRNKPDPLLRVGERDFGNRQGEFIWALRDVSFDVQQGGAVGIIGRNGAGKSTLLKILSRVTAPTSGLIRAKGRVASLLEVGTGFHPELTGRENIYLNGAIMGMSRAEVRQKLDEIVDFSGVEQFIDTPVKRYSSGMYVRLAFAVAAYLEPEILIVDEVLSVGDAAFQKKSLGKMGDVTQGGRTVLFVSHNMAAIRKLCSKGILITQGKISVEGDVDKVIDQYLMGGSSEYSPSIIIPHEDNDVGNGLSIKFYSSDHIPCAKFKINETWHISFEFELKKHVSQVIAAVGMSTLDSIPLATFWSKPRDLNAGKYHVGFNVNLPLKSCELEFAAGLSSYERAFFYKEHLGSVSISDVSINEQPFRSVGSGIFLTPQESEIQSLQ